MSDNSSDINKSSIRLLNILVKITRHIDNCLKTEIITNSKYNLLLDSLDNITKLLNNSNKYYSSKTETFLTRQKLIDTVFDQLNTLIVEIGAPTIDDLLYILYRININDVFNIDHPIHIFNTFFTPYNCELKPISDYNKTDDIERYNDICFYKLLPSDNFLLNLRGAQMKFPLYSKNTLINIYGYFDVDPLNLNKRQLVQKYDSFNIDEIIDSNKKTVVKTWSRASMIIPDFVGQTIAVHNGRQFVPVYVTENMVGHKLGEFSPTRSFRGHAGAKNKGKK